MKNPKYFYLKQTKEIFEKPKINKNYKTNFNKIYIYQVAQQLLKEDIETHQDCYRQTIKQ